MIIFLVFFGVFVLLFLVVLRLVFGLHVLYFYCLCCNFSIFFSLFNNNKKIQALVFLQNSIIPIPIPNFLQIFLIFFLKKEEGFFGNFDTILLGLRIHRKTLTDG
jgi:hypothetical protein